MKHLIICVCCLCCAGCSRSEEPHQVVLAQGKWAVELAVTESQRYRGLSDRPSLPAGHGMLFVFPSSRVLEFCMRRTLIPLDIAFLDERLEVVAIHTMFVEPYGAEMRVYSSGLSARYALEVNAGELDRAGVKVGDRAVFSQSILRTAKAAPAP